MIVESHDFVLAKMTASVTASTIYLCTVFIVLFNVYVDSQDTDAQLCQMCEGTVRQDSPVWDFCLTKGHIKGRCCFRNNTSNEDTIIGLDLANCSISHVEHLYNSSTAFIIDLSNNPISNLSDFIFQGFSQLTQLLLPSKLECPGGNASWEKVEVKNNAKICEGQINICNQTAQMPWDCPENSFCSPFGPGFFECSCLHNFHGYKCMRQGEFPIVKVLGILTGSTVVVSSLLWFTQRRKVKNT
ncbi:all-trans retinoic acid-induced differentiation factor [Carassius auratus]|uniref:All-trans retinoic acid-induced differentiation factor n=1 Tax=Carassius auratus TaxID=7957 RepID=A0A6P6RP04_CARAU|nr:all-trans retinoic acid-induced differentiation factor [Carassius auratus]XP_052443234.1 all-trans retinoic acid-induced differentiation factor [Carassius gibelio]